MLGHLFLMLPWPDPVVSGFSSLSRHQATQGGRWDVKALLVQRRRDQGRAGLRKRWDWGAGGGRKYRASLTQLESWISQIKRC